MKLIGTLKEIGLTNSEAKVYLALLKLGESSKTAIINEAGVASSKIYILLNKLMNKGLVSTIIKNGSSHFSAAPPSRIKEYLEIKEKEIEEQKNDIEKVLKKFEELQNINTEKTKAEIFIGWKGMETVYSSIISEMNQGQEAYILGASSGTNKEETKRFFVKYGIHSHTRKKADVKIIFNEDSRDYVTEAEEESGVIYNKRFLQKTAPVEIAITLSRTAIVILKNEPIVILIHDKETAESFISYFKELWKIAAK